MPNPYDSSLSEEWKKLPSHPHQSYTVRSLPPLPTLSGPNDADSLPTSDPFDAVLAPYTSLLPPAQPNVTLPDVDLLVEMESKGIPASGSGSAGRPKKDEWAGLY